MFQLSNSSTGHEDAGSSSGGRGPGQSEQSLKIVYHEKDPQKRRDTEDFSDVEDGNVFISKSFLLRWFLSCVLRPSVMQCQCIAFLDDIDDHFSSLDVSICRQRGRVCPFFSLCQET